MNAKSHFELVPRDTEKFEGLVLVDFGSVEKQFQLRVSYSGWGLGLGFRIYGLGAGIKVRAVASSFRLLVHTCGKLTFRVSSLD